MFVDGKDVGIGRIILEDEEFYPTQESEPIPTKTICICSKDETYSFFMSTTQNDQKFNELVLNKKTDVMGMIDDFDIPFYSKSAKSYNTYQNTKVFFTKIDENKYILNAEILNADIIDGDEDEFKNIEIEATIQF